MVFQKYVHSVCLRSLYDIMLTQSQRFLEYYVEPMIHITKSEEQLIRETNETRRTLLRMLLDSQFASQFGVHYPATINIKDLFGPSTTNKIISEIIERINNLCITHSNKYKSKATVIDHFIMTLCLVMDRIIWILHDNDSKQNQYTNILNGVIESDIFTLKNEYRSFIDINTLNEIEQLYKCIKELSKS